MNDRPKQPIASLDPREKKSARSDISDLELKSSQNHFAWSLDLADYDWKWGFGTSVFRNEWCKHILGKLKEFESKSWAIIANDSSGKTSGTRNHHVSVSKIDRSAQKRLRRIEMEDVDQLYSLRLTGKKRLFGVIHNYVLKVLWYDPNHEIFKSRKK